MSINFFINGAFDLEAVVTLIDGLTDADLTSSVDGANRQEVFADVDGADGVLEVTYGESFNTTSFTFFSGAQEFGYSISVMGELTLDAGYDLQAAWDTSPFNSYFVNDAGSRVQGTDAGEDFTGLGFVSLGGGDDLMRINPTNIFGEGAVGPDVIAIADAGAGEDVINVATRFAAVRGGADDDEITFAFGAITASGGSGADVFRADNGQRDALGYSDTASAAGLRVTLVDFDPSEDVFVFSRTDPSLEFGASSEISFADILGPGDLSTVDPFAFGGLVHAFRETAGGDAVLLRRGTDAEGHSYNERIVFLDVALDALTNEAIAYGQTGLVDTGLA